MQTPGVQAQAMHDAKTQVEDPESPKGDAMGPATKRQHFVVMRHGERIDEVNAKHCLHGQPSVGPVMNSLLSCSATPCSWTYLTAEASHVLTGSQIQCYHGACICCVWQIHRTSRKTLHLRLTVYAPVANIAWHVRALTQSSAYASIPNQIVAMII